MTSSAASMKGGEKLYEIGAGSGDSKLVYEGEFARGKKEGGGKSFDPATGNLVYNGEFFLDKYEGQGKLYNPDTQMLIYEGGFRMGSYDGKGKLYDQNGTLIYEGEFRLGTQLPPDDGA